MIIVNGGVTAAKGFLANGVKAGIKKSGKKDLALIYSEVPAVAAASFTTKGLRAPPGKFTWRNGRNGAHRAVIVNRGKAIGATGRGGIVTPWI